MRSSEKLKGKDRLDERVGTGPFFMDGEVTEVKDVKYESFNFQPGIPFPTRIFLFSPFNTSKHVAATDATSGPNRKDCIFVKTKIKNVDISSEIIVNC